MKRSVQVNVRLTEFEYWAASSASEFLDLTLSQWVRRSLRSLVEEAASKGMRLEVPEHLRSSGE
jgi:hypothetical protein